MAGHSCTQHAQSLLMLFTHVTAWNLCYELFLILWKINTGEKSKNLFKGVSLTYYTQRTYQYNVRGLYIVKSGSTFEINKNESRNMWWCALVAKKEMTLSSDDDDWFYDSISRYKHITNIYLWNDESLSSPYPDLFSNSPKWTESDTWCFRI